MGTYNEACLMSEGRQEKEKGSSGIELERKS
jgi:hypothetical protein